MSFSAVLNPTSQLIAASVGIPGPPGQDGEDGSQWFTGTGAPAPALGSPGDMYLENDGDVWQSSDASGWLVTPTNIRGPAGAAGAAGAAGPAGPQGPAGSVSSVGSHLLFSPDNTYDIGASGANRPRNLYLAGTATVGGQILGAAGTAALPSISFAADPNTGIYNVTGDTIGFATGGVQKWALNAAGQFYAAADYPIWPGDGTAAAPSFSWLNNPTTGIYRAGLHRIGFSTAGVLRWEVDASGHFKTLADNAYDLGQPANRPRNLYLAGTATVGGNLILGGYIAATGQVQGSFVGTSSGEGALRVWASGGVLQLYKATVARGNPGAGVGDLYFLDGTTAGTLKLVVRAGTAGAVTTVLDNIPQL